MSLQDRMQKYMTDLDREVTTWTLPAFFVRIKLTTLAVQVSLRCPIRAESRCVKSLSCSRYWLCLLLPHLLELWRTDPLQPGRFHIPWYLPYLVHFPDIAAYESIRAIESAGTVDDTQWLTYWVVFSFLNVIEYWSRTILYWLRMNPFLRDLSETCWSMNDSILLPFQDDYSSLARSSAVRWCAIYLPRLPPTCLGTPYRTCSRRTRYISPSECCW